MEIIVDSPVMTPRLREIYLLSSIVFLTPFEIVDGEKKNDRVNE